MALSRPSLLLLRLPPFLRTSLHLHSTHRSFSTSPSRRTTLTDALVTPSTHLLDLLHSTGLPWAAAIPLSALLIRGLFGYYFVSLPSQRAAQIRALLVPLAAIRARNHLSSPSVMKRRKELEDSPRFLGAMMRWEAFKARRRELGELGKDFGVSRYGGWVRGGVNFGLLLSMTEAIRMKAGSNEGLLPLIVKMGEWVATPFTWLVRRNQEFAEDVRAKSGAVTLSKDEQLAQLLEPAVSFDDQGRVIVDTSLIQRTPTPEKDYAAYIDETLQTDTSFLWLTDLTLPDPTFILPASIFVLLTANALFQPTVTNTLSSSQPRKLMLFGRFPAPTNYQRILMIMAGLFGYATIHFPSAMLLYFATSMAVGQVMRRLLARWYPLARPIEPCRRGMRMRVRGDGGWKG